MKTTDSVGVVMTEDFTSEFEEEFVNENFDKLARLWFKGVNSQVDFGIVLECVKDEIKNDYEKWKQEKGK